MFGAVKGEPSISASQPRPFDSVNDLLQDTINCSAESQSDADGELAWLRKRLENALPPISARPHALFYGTLSWVTLFPTVAYLLYACNLAFL